ncbi:MAG TPA: AraC family transcriptional regulator [Lachnospiraceae bacterium]|nr:AraC family transcriptional regulator [Lachnospiraceae bacterium]
MKKEHFDPVLDELLKNTSVSNNMNDFPVGAFFINLSQMPMPLINWHWHEEVELIIINNGHANIKLSDEAILLSPGEGIFLNQNILHSIQGVGKEECSLYTLKFHPSFLFGYHQTYLASLYLTSVLSSPTLHFLLLREEDETSGELLNLVNDTLACYLAKRFGFELKVKSLLCDLWYHLLQLTKSPDSQMESISKQASTDSTRIKQAMLYIEEHHMEQLTLDEIARSIHISKSECCRCFQRSLGLTPFEYLLKFRIFESTRKMIGREQEADSIATLASSVGFNSVSYFNKLFKKYMNCTPTEYRKSIQNSPQKKPEASL